jgi:hypothetical protein
MNQIGRVLIIAGISLAALGFILTALQKVPFMGRLPGDIHIKTENIEIFIPLTTCLLLSLIISLVIRLFTK